MKKYNNILESDRKSITEFLQWNDKNGCYTDENCDIEGVERMTYEDAVKYFFGVMNEDFYYNITDNIFELTYEDVIRYAKENNLYDKTMCKLEMLFNQKNIAETFYRGLLD
ncbi:MAG: hypothetical protein LLF98_04860 [Clostridium sp.]|uniref:hypothetical protein n=1 Tax=Clostridium sp. TaxID=1506 RepID=UPI0025BC5AE0|nr:hypothetical protein [Clostridium sp.]MCE5220604.1 hypothetical protein [Clostridium sp.]